MNMRTPDFASSYAETDEKVLELMKTLWKERLEPAGRPLQIDLRDEDFARAIPYYSFHLSKRPFQFAHLRGAHGTLVWSVFQSVPTRTISSWRLFIAVSDLATTG